MAFVVGPGGEEECRRRAVVRGVVPKLERPQAVDRQHPVTRPQLAVRLPAAFRILAERRDLAVPEVADQQVAAEAAEALGRRLCDAPRCVQLAMLTDPGEQLPARVERVDEALALPGDFVFGI